MFSKVFICSLFLVVVICGSAGITREALMRECLYSIEGKLAETNYTRDYVKTGEEWYFLSDEEEKELFNKAKVNDCSESGTSMEKKYQIGLKSTGEHSFEVKVQLQSK